MNFIIGDLKIRGKHKDLKKFLFEEITDYTNNQELNYYLGLSNNESSIVKFQTECSYGVASSESEALFFKSVENAYIYNNGAIACRFKDNGDDKYLEEEYILVATNFKSQEKIDVDILKDLSKKYNLDFKILAFESCTEFNQDVEIVGGEVIKNEFITFNDYKWECVCPNI